MSANLHAELARIDTELLRLHAQKELILRLLGQDTPAPTSPMERTPLRPRDYQVRPTNPAATDAILEAVQKYPNKTVMEIAEIVGKQRGADKKEVSRLYNVVYGLARRGRIVKDDHGRVSMGAASE